MQHLGPRWFWLPSGVYVLQVYYQCEQEESFLNTAKTVALTSRRRFPQKLRAAVAAVAAPGIAWRRRKHRMREGLGDEAGIMRPLAGCRSGQKAAARRLMWSGAEVQSIFIGIRNSRWDEWMSWGGGGGGSTALAGSRADRQHLSCTRQLFHPSILHSAHWSLHLSGQVSILPQGHTAERPIKQRGCFYANGHLKYCSQNTMWPQKKHFFTSDQLWNSWEEAS